MARQYGVAVASGQQRTTVVLLDGLRPSFVCHYRHGAKLGDMSGELVGNQYFAVTRGQQLNFISTSTSTGWVVLTEMT